MAALPPPEVHVKLNLESTIYVAGRSHPVRARGLGRPLLYLVLLRGASAHRKAMAQLLWPGESEEAAANLLRISFSRLKKVFGESLIADRTHVRLVGVPLHFDLEVKLAQLQDVLDEVDSTHQFHQLISMAEDLRYVGWRAFLPLDASGILREWEHAGRTAIGRLMELAATMSAPDEVELAWQLMQERGDLDMAVCERFLEASQARGDLEAGLRKIKRMIQEQGRKDANERVEALLKHAERLKQSSPPNAELPRSHAELLGQALLRHLPRTAPLLAEIVAISEVQFQMQSVPANQLEILDAILIHLEPESPPWVDVQAARLSAYGSLYNSDMVLEICRSMFPCKMEPGRASTTWMHYSFALFQLRQWDEAISSIQQAQHFALQGEVPERFEIGRITEAAYLWHLGRFEEARLIYDDYLGRFDHSEDFLAGVNVVIVHANYAIVELVFGDIEVAKHHVDIAYGRRSRFNLARLMPNLLCSMGVIYARTDELHRGIEFIIEGLKQTYARSSSREGQLNMEWACGALVVGGLRAEAWQVMHWVNEWRIRTRHTRSVCEERYAESLGLGDVAHAKPRFPADAEYREVMRHLIKCLRLVQANYQPSG